MSPSPMYPEDMQAVYRVIPHKGFYFVTCESTLLTAYTWEETGLPTKPEQSSDVIIIACLNDEDKAEDLASALREIVIITIPHTPPDIEFEE